MVSALSHLPFPEYIIFVHVEMGDAKERSPASRPVTGQARKMTNGVPYSPTFMSHCDLKLNQTLHTVRESRMNNFQGFQ